MRAMLSLRAVPGLGDIRLRQLLELHGSPAAALAALRRDRPDAAAYLARPVVVARIEHCLRTIEETADLCVVSIGAPDYPASLLHLHDPPVVLFARGDLSLSGAAAIAIVGTRTNTEYGAEVARAIAAAAASAGLVVVSGLAHGIDRHAHEAVLEAGGRTTAVIGCGIDVAYPPQHAQLQERIAARGLVLSEFAPGQPALGHHFPRRNRIIAALAAAVVVVEAPRRSGALITAEHALELGREVLAVPGPIGRRTSEGTNALIRDGASLVLDPADVIDVVRNFHAAAGAGGATGVTFSRARSPGQPASTSEDDSIRTTKGSIGPRESAHADGRSAVDVGPERAGLSSAGQGSRPVDERGAPDGNATAAERLLAGLGDEPVHADTLVERSGLPAAEALAVLLDLELSGRIRQHPGSRFSSAASAEPRRVPRS